MTYITGFRTTTTTTMSVIAFVSLLLLCGTIIPSTFVSAGTSNHQYTEGEHVELWVNKVGPYANPQEAYEYYTLPYCAPDTKHHPDLDKNDASNTQRFNEWKFQSIGEHLGGHRLRHSGHDITFTTNSQSTVKKESCTTKPLSETEATDFKNAIEHRWFYQMYLDDLPVWGMVGELLPDDPKAVELLLSGKNTNGQGEQQSDLYKLDHDTTSKLGSASSSLIPYIYTSRNLTIKYNKNQIVQVDLDSTANSLQKVMPGNKYEFILNVYWIETDSIDFNNRFNRYLDHEFFKHPIHWFSVFNSFMMVLFLMGLVALILLRTLKKDYARYGIVNDLEDGNSGGERDNLLLGDDSEQKGNGLIDKHTEDSGWKQVHGDVFRAPQYLQLFAALIGTGWQLVVLTLGVIVFAVLGPLHGEVHEERGEVVHSIIFCYCISSIVSGYQSGKFFKLYYPTTTSARRIAASNTTSGGSSTSSTSSTTSQWQIVMLLTVLLLPCFTIQIIGLLNTVSLLYGTINTIPFLVIVKLFFIWVFVSVPLCVIGTMIGRHTLGTPGSSSTSNGNSNGGKVSTGSILDHFPCRVNAIPRPIPEDVPWYGKPIGLIPLAGLLSFGSIFIELYYVLTSLWNYKFYHVYGFLLGVYTILIIVVSMTSIIVVYFCLNSENYLWHWISFASGSSTALYVFLYGIYYYIFKTQMYGLLQFIFYFSYMILLSCNLGILCGTIGYYSASQFVFTIFQNVKVD